MPLAYSLPVVNRTWVPGMPIKTPALRGTVADTVAVLSAPPMFTGTQATPQACANNTDTPLNIDTETYDNASGHVSTTSAPNYYGMAPGWYLAQGCAGPNYTGGTGAFQAGIGYSTAGGAQTTYYGRRMPTSGTSGKIPYSAVAKLAELTNVGVVGGSSNDYLNLTLTQSSGGSANTFSSGSQVPAFQVTWVATAGGPVGVSVPTNDPWPTSPTTLTAQANSGATSIQVAAAAGLIAGGTVGLGTGTSTAETATIAATYTTGSLTVPLTAGLAHAHANGSAVAVPVSAAFLNHNVRDACNALLYPPIMEAYYLAGTQTLAQQNALPATGTTVNLDTKTVDNYSGFSTSTHTWTVPAGWGGVYWCYGQCEQAMNSTSHALAAGLTITSANYNGGTAVTLWGGAQLALTTANMNNCAMVRRRLRLNAGDTVKLAAFQNDSGTASTTLNYNAGTGFAGESRLICVWRSA